jgi:hypothetical protein
MTPVADPYLYSGTFGFHTAGQNSIEKKTSRYTQGMIKMTVVQLSIEKLEAERLP